MPLFGPVKAFSFKPVDVSGLCDKGSFYMGCLQVNKKKETEHKICFYCLIYYAFRTRVVNA